jgi:hypothetical protein
MIMKKLRSILLVFIFAGINLSAFCQVTSSQPKVKSLVITEEKNDMLIKKQYKDSETYYDSNGNILEEINYKEGKVTRHFKYQYDKNNNKIREEEYDASGRIVEFSEYKYQNGLRTEKVVYDGGKKIKLKKVYTYTLF